MSETLKKWKRTVMCGEVSQALQGQEITLMGWVQRVRNLGGLIFVWLRDHTGIVQLVFDIEQNSQELFALGEELRGEYVVAVKGKVVLRDADAINEKLSTGNIEVLVHDAVLLNKAQTPPMYIEEETKEAESLRLKYRYLDLRRIPMQNMLRFRNKVIRTIQHYMDEQGFLEVETPILTKSTPEGARDYLVPTRVKAETFYALPQSPQIYKQLLMVGGTDRYYQVAKCFRDEDGRADRQPEFTQLDVEMSFVDENDIQQVIEGSFAAIFKEVMNIELDLPLPRMTWEYAMENYGSDKPDTRFDMKIQRVDNEVRDSGFVVFENALKDGSIVCGVKVTGGADKFSRKELDALGEFVKTYHVKGLAWAALQEDGNIRSSFIKAMKQENVDRLFAKLGAEAGDLIFLIADKKYVALNAMGQLRLKVGKELSLLDENRYNLFWVTEFPLMEFSEEENRFVAMHHPFTSPMEEDIQYMEKDLGKVRARAYDLVLNGIEMGSGSIRIHTSDLQAKMFEMIGLSKEEANERFGFLLEAFKYGTPPHGGFAYGIDRLIMVLLKKESLRDVLAFPKAQGGSCLMMDTPSTVNKEQLSQLHISFLEEDKPSKG
ncbi:MAG: aspartate--tRNA ligase [Clostridiales bacterium]|nr:aspartate--tRNA ligase [Clostridiales bacterium]